MPGVYSGVNFRNVNLSGVTITSSDPANAATITSFNVRDSSGLTFTNINFTAQSRDETQTMFVYGSKDIHFDHVVVSAPGGNVAETLAQPFTIRSSTNISVTNSEFHDLWSAIGLGTVTNLTIAGNYFHDIRMDGVRGGGLSNVNIVGNYFTDFYPGSGDHADAIQIWTTNMTEVAHDIVVADNAFVRGDGGKVQGIFIRDTYDTLPFEAVTITGNLILGGNANGIALDGAKGGIISGNTVVGLDGDKSWIRTVNVQDVAVQGNFATYYMTAEALRGVLDGNDLVATPTDGGASIVNQWMALHGAVAGLWIGSGETAVAVPAPDPTTQISVPGETQAPPESTSSAAPQESSGTTNDTSSTGGTSTDTTTAPTSSLHVMLGTSGDDNYSVTSVNDIIKEVPNGGNDTVSTWINYTLAPEVEILRLKVEGLIGTGNELDNRIVGSGGSDHIFGMDGNDLVQGVNGDDWISGGNGDDDLRGDVGNDTIFGDAGADKLIGGAGADVLIGGAGDDLLEGGEGADVLTGGDGSDAFQFRQEALGAGDVITDFGVGADRIVLRPVDAVVSTSSDDAFRFIGNQAFHHIAGELRYEVQGSNLLLLGDTNGDGYADLTILLQGVQAISSNQIVL